jgi:hypothetical protein
MNATTVTATPDRLQAGTEAYEAIAAKVEQLWDEFEDDFSKYPKPAEISREFDGLLLPYGNNRTGKCRNLYNKLVNQQFQKHG